VFQNELKLYELLFHLKNKRRHIQRYSVFEKPIYSISLEELSSKDEIQRYELQTDETSKIKNIPKIPEDIKEDLIKAGYYRLSDIYFTPEKIIRYENRLPRDAIRQLYKMASKERKVLLKRDRIIETQDKNTYLKSLINETYLTFLHLEYSIARFVIESVKSKINFNPDNNTKKSIKNINNNLITNKYNNNFIAFCLDISESYVQYVTSGRADANLNKSEREYILERDNNQCRYCNSKDSLEIHHVIPVYEGGDKSMDNLCTLCEDCHLNIAHGNSTKNITYNTKIEFWKDVIQASEIPKSIDFE